MESSVLGIKLFTMTEKRYAQAEKEAFSVKWCYEKLADFPVGLPKFIIKNKPQTATDTSKENKRLDELTS